MRDKSDAQVGIGTLIVFIAMILIASITAAVFYGIVGSLGGQAQTTGDRASENIKSGLSIVSVSGNVTNEGTVDIVNVLVKMREGSESLDLSDGTIHYTDQSHEAWLTYGSDANNTHYAVLKRQEGGAQSFPTLEHHLDRYAFELKVGNVTSTSSSIREDKGLPGGSSAVIEINPSVGNQIVKEINVPSVLTGDTVDLN